MKIVKRVLLAVLLAGALVFPMSYDNAYVHILLSQTLDNIVIVMGLNFITAYRQMNLGTPASGAGRLHRRADQHPPGHLALDRLSPRDRHGRRDRLGARLPKPAPQGGLPPR